jgi:hypothetical protein
MPQQFLLARRRAMSRKIWSALVLFLIAPGLSGQTTPLKPGPQNKPAPHGIPIVEADQMTNIPYFTLRDGMSSALTLINNAPSETPVSITLFNTEGRSKSLSVTLEPHAFKQIELRDVIGGAGESQGKDGEDFDSGNIEVSYHGIPMRVTCQVSVYSLEKRVSFESREQEMMDFESANMNGILSLSRKNARGFLAVTNVSKNEVTVYIAAGSKSKAVKLFSRETKIVKLNEDFDVKAPAATLVKLTQNGLPGDIITTGFVLDMESGYSSTFSMVDPKLAISTRLAGAHLRVGAADPDESLPAGTHFSSPLLLANVSDKPVTAHVSADYTTQEKLQISAIDPQADNTEDKFSTTAAKDITIAPGEVQAIELSEALPGNSFKEAGVDIRYEAAPGSIIGELTSVDQTGDYAFEVPIKDPEAKNAGVDSTYPWSLEGNLRTVVHLKNTTDKAVSAFATIAFPGGFYILDRMAFQPHQTIAIDLQKIKDSKKKDVRGNSFPADAMSGQITWGEEPASYYSMIGRAEQVDSKAGIAKSFSCTNDCCTGNPGYTETYYLTPNPIIGVIGDQATLTGNMTGTQCDGTPFGPYTVSTSPSTYANPGQTWWTDDPNIASVTPGQTVSATVTFGPNEGDTNTWASFFARESYEDCGIDCTYTRCYWGNYEDDEYAQTRVAHPVGLYVNNVGTTGNGDLIFDYRWSSSTGNLADIQHCFVNERLDFPTQPTYTYPAAMCGDTHNSPEFRPNPAVNAGEGQVMDTFAGCFAKPYAATGVIHVTQHIQYICGTMNGPNNLSGAISMNSSISQNADGTFRYSEDDQGVPDINGVIFDYAATLNPLP